MALEDYRRTPSAGVRAPKGSARRLAAILGADVRGYGILMSQAEEDTHSRVGDELDRFRRAVEKSHGRVFTFAGDGLMAEFPSSVEALKCALRVQAEAARRNAALAADRRIDFRIGINSGDVIVQKGRTAGHTVNVAARLEQLAEPGGICLSEAVYGQVRRIVTASYELLGEQRLKNVREPVVAYRIRADDCRRWVGMPALPRLSAATADDAVTEYRASLAVLPFRTLHKDQSDAYFAEGMVDDIIRAIGGLKDLLVIARSSTQMFAGAPLDLRRVGHELDVRYVLHGSVRRAGEALRIAVELTEAQSGQVIWADRFDGVMAELFALQDRIAIRVATAIAPSLRERELARVLHKPPDSMTAYDLTLQALDLMHRLDRASVQKAARLLEKAIVHDANYAPAYSHKAWLLLRWIAQGWSQDDMADREAASKAAHHAIQRDPGDALGLAIYGHLQSYLLKAFSVGNDYLERAIAAGPSCAWAWGYSSVTRGYLGDTEAAVARAERGVRLSPLGADAYWFEHYLSQAYYLADRFDDAVDWARMSATRVGANTSNLRCLIASLVALGEMNEARRLAIRHMELAPSYSLTIFRARTPFRGAARDAFAERLRLAGLPA